MNSVNMSQVQPDKMKLQPRSNNPEEKKNPVSCSTSALITNTSQHPDFVRLQHPCVAAEKHRHQRRKGDEPLQVVHHAQAIIDTYPVLCGNTSSHTFPELWQNNVHAHVNPPSHVTPRHEIRTSGPKLVVDTNVTQLLKSSSPSSSSHYTPSYDQPFRQTTVQNNHRQTTVQNISPDRRESSASVTSSLGSYDSGATLTTTTTDMWNVTGSNIDTVISARLRRSMEQKEEFLRAQPTHREFYARPQRLQKTIWPPNDFEPNLSKQCSSQLAAPSIEVSSANDAESIIAIDTSHDQKQQLLPAHRLANHKAREEFYNGIQKQNKQNRVVLQDGDSNSVDCIEYVETCI